MTAAAPAPSTGSRRRLAVAVVAPLAALLLLEGGFRVYEARREARKVRILVEDPLTGHRLRPDLRQAADAEGTEHTLTTNAAGYRGRELAPVKPAGGFRVACLGGSTTFGFGVSLDDRTYPSVLEELLRAAAPGRPVEVLNAGVPRWSMRTSLDNFAARLAPLDFDVVVLKEALNDLYDGWDAAYLARSALPLGEALPPDPLQRSAIVRWVTRTAGKARLASKRSTHSPEGLATYRRTLAAGVALVRARGAKPVLCTYPTMFPPTAEEAARLRFDVPFNLESMLKRCPLEYDALRVGLIAYNDAIRVVAREAGVDLVDLDALIPDDPALYADPFHQDDDGQRALASAVAELIVRNGWLTPAR